MVFSISRLACTLLWFVMLLYKFASFDLIYIELSFSSCVAKFVSENSI